MLNSHHASTSGALNDELHLANSAISGNLCNSWSDFVSLDLHHSVFAVNPVNKTAYGKDIWILDTGATDHIVHSLSLFTHITSSISTFVQLPNGEKVIVTHIGTIQVTPTLKLENVLCVPSFNFNLISVSKLTKTLSCCLVFLSTLCFIQDLTCWKTIGVGELHDNLYLLNTASTCKSVPAASSTIESIFQSFVNSVSNSLSIPSVTKPYLWHMRLGHASDNKLHALQNYIPDSVYLECINSSVLQIFFIL